MKKGLLLFQTLLLGSVLPVMAQQVKPNLPWVDISSDRGRQIVLSEGTPELYNGHPTTVMLDDNKTIYCTWSFDHGGDAGLLAVSKDSG